MGRINEPWEIKHRLIVKAEEETNPGYGSRPEDRPLEEHMRFGIINLDKPSGPSSHEVTAWLKRLLNLVRAGRGNPKVTGVLPHAINDATKIVQALLLAGKEYVCVMKLHSQVPQEKVQKVLDEFQGPIYQRPPVRSAVKRKLRTRTIYYIDLLEMDERNVLFRVGCEAGTYIRKLCYDIGEVLGCGAHMQELRRTRVGPFTEDDTLVTLHDISYLFSRWQETKDEKILRKFVSPMEKALQLLPKIHVRDSAVDALCHGAHLTAPGVLSFDSEIKTGDTIAVFTQKGEAITIAKAVVSSEKILSMDHGFVAKTKRVLMPRGIYPKKWHSTQK
jgi:H/ACA ribonucleoprotein complex subunit 4